VNPILEQIRFMRKIVGFGRLMRMRKKHSLGLGYARGYVTTICLWSLLNTGLLDELREKGAVNLAEFADRNNLDLAALESVCEYLDGLRVLRFEQGVCSLQKRGTTLMEEPRGLFDLLYGYEPVFRDLEPLLRKIKTYGKDITRRGEAVAKGSGELGRQLPFLAVRELVFSNGFRRVLDLGCGDLEFLFLLCENPEIICYGIDNDAATVEYARKRLKEANLAHRITIEQGNMFAVKEAAQKFRDVDAITAIDVFHEYLSNGTDTISFFLRTVKRHFPDASLVVAEFFKLPQSWLRRIPTVTLEHHLFHSLTNQVILPIGEWVKLFESSGYQVVEKKLLHAIGHGYFVLK